MKDNSQRNDAVNRSTDDLSAGLSEYRDISSFLESNRDAFIAPDVGSAVSGLLRKKKLSKSALAARSGMSEVYLYQILSGRRSPSRDRMICLCIGLGCSLEETQGLLRQNGFAVLYPKVRRDAVIMFAIREQWDVHRLNDALYENEEETMF